MKPNGATAAAAADWRKMLTIPCPRLVSTYILGMPILKHEITGAGPTLFSKHWENTERVVGTALIHVPTASNCTRIAAGSTR